MSTAPNIKSDEAAKAASIKIASRPHMPAEAVEFLTAALGGSKCYLEYGSGGSTRLAASMSVPLIYSVESDADFRAAVQRQASQGSTSNIKMVEVSVGPTKEWGYPVDRSRSDLWTDYPFKAWSVIEGDAADPDLILIDGRFRVACFLTSLIKAKPGTTILFDDYQGRRARYGRVERYVQPSEFCERTAIFKVPDLILNMQELAVDLAVACTNPQ